MWSSLSCVPEASLNTTAYSAIFDYICGADPTACKGINGNTTTGVYGAYSMCNTTQQLGYVLDAYYKAQSSDSTACDFEGQAVTTKGTTASTCSAKLASASSENAAAATATSAVTGTGSSGSSSSSSSFAVPMAMKNQLTIGDFAVGLYALFAMGVGAAVVAL
jgi:1,3-beta-glucanosyltransferase GAS1